jgi:hypothetical protein
LEKLLGIIPLISFFAVIGRSRLSLSKENIYDIQETVLRYQMDHYTYGTVCFIQTDHEFTEELMVRFHTYRYPVKGIVELKYDTNRNVVDKVTGQNGTLFHIGRPVRRFTWFGGSSLEVESVIGPTGRSRGYSYNVIHDGSQWRMQEEVETFVE